MADDPNGQRVLGRWRLSAEDDLCRREGDAHQQHGRDDGPDDLYRRVAMDLRRKPRLCAARAVADRDPHQHCLDDHKYAYAGPEGQLQQELDFVCEYRRGCEGGLWAQAAGQQDAGKHQP